MRWARVHDYTQECALTAHLGYLNSFTRAIISMADISEGSVVTCGLHA
jgi:hypothetical protein